MPTVRTNDTGDARRARKRRSRPPRTFKYEKPPSQETAKAIVGLCQTDIIRGAVQVIKEGGDNNLHSHTGMDGFWMGLRGRARYYGPGDEVLGEFGVHEGIVMPRGAQYWFESIGDEDLELLQVVAFDRDVKNERIDIEPRKFEGGSAQRFNGKTG